MEFDYRFGSNNATTGRKDTDVTVDGTKVTAVTDYGDDGGANWNFRLTGSEFVFRVSPNNYLYTNDIDRALETVVTGYDGYVYYQDTNYEDGKVYFDAKGYRYFTGSFTDAIKVDNKYYLDDPEGTAPTVSGLSLPPR